MDELFFKILHYISSTVGLLGVAFIILGVIKIFGSGENNRADKVIRRIIGRKDTGGGHQTYTGGQIPVIRSSQSECVRLEKLVRRRFLKVLGVDEKNYDMLVP